MKWPTSNRCWKNYSGFENRYKADELPESSNFASVNTRRNFGETQADQNATWMSVAVDRGWNVGTGQGRGRENLRRIGEDWCHHRSFGAVLGPQRPGLHHCCPDGGSRFRRQGTWRADPSCLCRPPG